MTNLYFQNPDDTNSHNLLEALLDASAMSDSGGGAYAFATKSGLELLLDDEVFISFVNRGSFDLIIGVDAITSIKALDKINQYIANAPTLSAKVLMATDGVIFHPKVSWFRRGNTGILVCGSGNLTDAGLRYNWESISISHLNQTEVNSVETSWNLFKQNSKNRLVDLNHPEVIRKARLNSKAKFRTKSKTKKSTITSTGNSVLIAEIPNNNKRFTQANFHKKTFVGFFGAHPGTQHRVVFYNVDCNGVLQHREIRPSVTSKSKNYRFELGALSGKSYPSVGRPIGVYIMIAVRTFKYSVLFPNDNGYTQMHSYLSKSAKKKGHQMLEVLTTEHALKAIWPESPLWKISLPEDEFFDPSLP